MKFNNSQRNRANGGSIRWINHADKKAMCTDYSWRGKITDLKS